MAAAKRERCEAAVVGEFVVHQSDGVGAGRAEHNMALCVFVEPGDDKGLDRCDPLDEALGDGADLVGGEGAVEGVCSLVEQRCLAPRAGRVDEQPLGVHRAHEVGCGRLERMQVDVVKGARVAARSATRKPTSIASS